jgi:hypothetical protein
MRPDPEARPRERQERRDEEKCRRASAYAADPGSGGRQDQRDMSERFSRRKRALNRRLLLVESLQPQRVADLEGLGPARDRTWVEPGRLREGGPRLISSTRLRESLGEVQVGTRVLGRTSRRGSEGGDPCAALTRPEQRDAEIAVGVAVGGRLPTGPAQEGNRFTAPAELPSSGCQVAIGVRQTGIRAHRLLQHAFGLRQPVEPQQGGTVSVQCRRVGSQTNGLSKRGLGLFESGETPERAAQGQMVVGIAMVEANGVATAIHCLSGAAGAQEGLADDVVVVGVGRLVACRAGEGSQYFSTRGLDFGRLTDTHVELHEVQEF